MPAHDLYLDDMKIGDRWESASRTMGEDEIIEFAKIYDPQPMHIDREGAKKTIHGGIISSGFQTFALSFRRFYELGMLKDANLGGIGVDELRWPRPVRPGDTVRTIVEVMEITPSKSKPDRGVLKTRYTVLNQRDEPVLTCFVLNMVKRRRD